MYGMHLELAVVDMAGITIQKNGVVERSLRRGLERACGAVPLGFDERFRAMRGTAKYDMCLDLIGGDRVTAGQALEFFDEEVHAAVDRGEFAPVSGARDALHHLAGLGLKVRLTTGFSRSSCDHVLDALAWRTEVDLSLSSDDVGRGRPWRISSSRQSCA